MTQWYGLLAPASLNAAHADKLAAEAARAVRSTASREKLAADSAEAIGNTPAQFAQFIAQEQARWKAVVSRAKIKPD
jgi:tripartite-type tricarboxylate transporter receptor subunit TctC